MADDQLDKILACLASQCEPLQATCTGNIMAPTLRQSGRKCLATALGTPVPPSAPIMSRPVSPKPGQRCSALDGPVLAEACRALGLTAAPWPPVRTTKACADRVLEVAGALGDVALTRACAGYDQIAEWAIAAIAALLATIAASREAAENEALRNRRRRQPGVPENGWGTGFSSGESVLAHWALPDGRQSAGVEDATVLNVDPVSKTVRLRYVDGTELSVPACWVICRYSPCTSTQIADVTLEAGSDAVLERLVWTSAPLAEICARVRHLSKLPKSEGFSTLATAVRATLPQASQAVARRCIDVLCFLCGTGFTQDAAAARYLANAILLSGRIQLPCSQDQLRAIRSASALSKAQKSQLEEMTRFRRWEPVAY